MPGIKEFVEKYGSGSVLDAGCGDGQFTKELSPHCRFIVAGDRETSFVRKAGGGETVKNLSLLCLDAVSLPFKDDEFDLVTARAILHHEKNWREVLDELFRVSKGKVLIEEPYEDKRNEGKVNAAEAMAFYLRLQNETGYVHFRYLTMNDYDSYFKMKNLSHQISIIRSDEEIGFEEYFRFFEKFADRSRRKDYWYSEFEKLKREFSSKTIFDDDLVCIEAEKKSDFLK
ncbi:class I SAM-dependent methyltransferase [candidate division WOR-3 bacterium]|nr:class I SAM-dependent methyltransferase [candidate division WOR-3 bacterium]